MTVLERDKHASHSTNGLGFLLDSVCVLGYKEPFGSAVALIVPALRSVALAL